MYVLIMIVLLGGQGVNSTHLYYETEDACYKAAKQFVSHENQYSSLRLKAFCIKGE